MRPTILIRLALAGTRTDTLRVALTALSAVLATLAFLAALTVLAIPTPLAPDPNSTSDAEWSTQYTNALLREPGLRPGVSFALVLLTIPVLALAGQCVRLGAPARDRRLAAMRLAGATPRQAVAVAATETGVASMLGTAVGFATYLLGRELGHRPDADGRLTLPTDVLPSVPALAAVLVGIPLLATLAAGVMMRRVTVTAFGVVRKAGRARGPGPWPALLIAAGVLAVAAIQPLHLWYDRTDRVPPHWLLPALLFGGGLFGVLGVVFGNGWISYTAGWALHRFARRPAALLAARRLTADAWSGSRTFAALLACVVFGAGAAGVRAWFTAEEELRAAQERLDAAVPPRGFGAPDSFYQRSMDLVDLAVIVALVIAAGGLLVALAEGIVSRRRAYAALVATGVPRAVLGRAILWQSMAPALPAVLLALVVGALLPRAIHTEVSRGGSTSTICDAGEKLCGDPATSAQYTRTIHEPFVTRDIPVPFDHLALFGAGALAAVLVTVGVGLLLLRSSTAVEELRTT